MRISPESFSFAPGGTFIAFEGINGCGKTTLLRSLVSVLEKLAQHRGEVQEIITTREPGGTPLGVELRKLLLSWSGEKKSDLAELLLFAADRAEHTDKVIRPALERGAVVVSDRTCFSTITFQGYGRGVSRSWIDQTNALAMQGVMPHLVILLDLDPKVAMARIAARTGNGADAFEDEALAFHERIRNGFLACADESPVPFLVLDATKTPEQLVAEVAAFWSADYLVRS
jgi:dTMP kinase